MKSTKASPRQSRSTSKRRRGHGKGAKWERETARRLSLWVTAGKRDDLFWRTSMSGGRATIRKRKGEENRSQVGDIGAIDPEGAWLLEQIVVECKFYRNLDVLYGFLSGAGKLRRFWDKHYAEAKSSLREPFMVAKENHLPALLLTTTTAAHALKIVGRPPLLVGWYSGTCSARVLVYLFDSVIPTLKHWSAKNGKAKRRS